MTHRHDCIEMGLSSGSRLLEGLELRGLGVMRMAAVISVEEVEWMVQN